MAARHRLGGRRRCAPAPRCRGAPSLDGAGGRSPRRVQRGRRAGDRGRRAQRSVRRVDPCARRRRSRPDRTRGPRRARRDLTHGGRAGGHVRARPRDDPGPRGQRLHARSLAAVDGPLNRGRLAGLPRRRAVLHSLREDRGHGGGARGRAGRRAHRVHRGQGPARRHRSQPDPAVRGQRRHPGGHHRGAPARPPVARPHKSAAPSGSHLRGRARGLPEDPAPRGHAGRPAPVRPDGVGPQLRAARHQHPDRARRGRSTHPGGDDGGRRRRVRGRD